MNFEVLELYKVIKGSDKVAFTTKKVHFDKVKLFCENKFYEDPSNSSRGRKCMRMGRFYALFYYFTVKITLEQNFGIVWYIILPNH